MTTPNKKYWKDRAAQLEKAIQENAEPAIKTIQDAYVEAIKNINADMKAVIRGMSKASGITEDEAEKLINAPASNELYKELVRLYDETEDERAKKDIALKINRQAYGARMTRLEALKVNVYNHLMRARNTEQKTHKALHAETIQKSYYSNINNIAEGFDVGINFTILPTKTIDKALSAKWLGANYSTRIWNNNKQFIEKVQRTITDGITAGQSVNRMADKLLDFVAVEGTGQRYIAERLVRTETAHFMAEGQLAAYKEAGIEKYQFVAAFDEHTCDQCGGLDGEIFSASEALAGENYPPIHANCRCTTVLAGFEPSTRIARDPETGENYKVDGNMTYSEWKRSLTPEQKSAMDLHVRQAKNKSADMKQYEHYRERLGSENVPKTFDKWQYIKYNDKEKYRDLTGFYRYKHDNAAASLNDYHCAKELHKLFPTGSFHIPAKEIDTVSLRFDDTHINKERLHNVSERQAKEYINNAKASRTVWNGKFERYYSAEGVSFVNNETKSIRTAFSKGQFNDEVNKIMEALKKYGI